jgi:hypothetical protein
MAQLHHVLFDLTGAEATVVVSILLWLGLAIIFVIVARKFPS